MNTLWMEQPQEYTEINWDNPITRGLKFAETPFIRSFTPNNSPGVSRVSTGELGYSLVASSNQYLKNTSTIVANYPLTFLAIHKRDSRPFDGCLVSIGAGTQRHTLYVNQDGVAMFSGSGASTAQAYASVLGTDTSSTCWTAGRVFSSNRRDIWNNGQLYATDTNNISTTSSDTAVIGAYWNNNTPSIYYNGKITLAIGWDRALEDSELKSLYANPWQLFKKTTKSVFFGSPQTSYALTADPGTYSLTGQAATLLRSKVISASNGSYSLTGQNATITYGSSTNYSLTADVGTYSIVGQSATLLRNKVVSASHGTYTTSGQAATVAYSGSNTITLKAGSWLRYRIIS